MCRVSPATADIACRKPLHPAEAAHPGTAAFDEDAAAVVAVQLAPADNTPDSKAQRSALPSSTQHGS